MGRVSAHLPRRRHCLCRGRPIIDHGRPTTPGIGAAFAASEFPWWEKRPVQSHSAAEKEGRVALWAGDSLAMVMREGLAASAAVAEKNEEVDEEERRLPEAAAERHASEEAAKAARKMDLNERRQSAEQAVAERSVAVNETNASAAESTWSRCSRGWRCKDAARHVWQNARGDS